MSRWRRCWPPPPRSREPECAPERSPDRSCDRSCDVSADIAVDDVVDLLGGGALAHVLVGALLAAPELVAVGLLRGHQHDRDVGRLGIGLEGAAGLEAVLDG